MSGARMPPLGHHPLPPLAPPRGHGTLACPPASPHSMMHGVLPRVQAPACAVSAAGNWRYHVRSTRPITAQPIAARPRPQRRAVWSCPGAASFAAGGGSEEAAAGAAAGLPAACEPLPDVAKLAARVEVL